jgi:hypothetical protein
MMGHTHAAGDASIGLNVQATGPFKGHSPDQDRPLGGYAILIATYFSLVGGFLAWVRASGRKVPTSLPPGDAALLAAATFKGSRIIAKDRVTSAVRAPFTRFQGDAGPGEVDEAARGRGLRRAIGELLVCPYCLSAWVAAFLTAGYVVSPALTRLVATILTLATASEKLHEELS